MPEMPAGQMPAGHWLLEGSARPAPVVVLGVADPDQRLSVSIIVRRRSDGPPYPDLKKLAAIPPALRNHLSREEFAARYGAEPADLERVAVSMRGYGLTVEETSPARRTVLVSGTVAQFNRAFGVELMRHRSAAGTYLSYAGQVYVPNELNGIVEDVLGLDREPALFNRTETPPLPDAPANIKVLTPPQVAALYQFPPGTGAGETIGILEFGGGFYQNDIADYFTNILNAPAPASAIFWPVNNATNNPGVNVPGDLEQIVDICVAYSVAPDATIVVYKPPDASMQSWHDCLSSAIHDSINKPSVLTCSWFGAESAWIASPKHLATLTQDIGDAQVLGVTILFASGDNGTTTPPVMLYPPADPGVTACGGTLVENVSGSSFDQIGWRFSGGGASAIFTKPSWQVVSTPPNASGAYSRAIPDVAGNADKYSGYMVYYNGKISGPHAGTSAVAPLYAGLIAIINQNLNKRVGFLNYYLYASESIYPQTFYDVTKGSSANYSCKVGWDAVTGLGSINGEILQRVLGNPCWSLQADVNNLMAAVAAIANSIGSGEIPPNKNVQQELSQLIDELVAAREALAKCRQNSPV